MDTVADGSLLSLAEKVLRDTKSIIEQLKLTGYNEPNFSISSVDVPSNSIYHSLRDSLNDTTQDLLLLVNGPKISARKFLLMHHDLAAYQIAFDYDFFRTVPMEKTIKLSILARTVNLDEHIVARVMYMLCTHRVFAEVETGEFGHTPGSIIFAQDAGIRNAAEYQLDEFFKATGHTSTALRKGCASAFQYVFGMPLFQYYAENPGLGARFDSAMVGITKLDRPTVDLVNGYAWDDLEGATIVDVGGGSGHASLALAKAFPKLQFIVQDINPTVFPKPSTEVDGQVRFMEHDFFREQPIRGAAAYLLRQITHNWDDEKCIDIFKALVPALEANPSGSHLLINDIIMQTHGQVSRFQEHGLRQIDMMMHVSLGSKQRTEQDFAELIKHADQRLAIHRSHFWGSLGLLEIRLRQGNDPFYDDK